MADMSQLIRVASWQRNPAANVIFVHGLGGHAYGTWQHGDNDGLWPGWLAQDVPGLCTWTMSYAAPPTNWLGNAMPLQDRAVNLLERLLVEPGLSDGPLIFVCHSLGGLVVKQVLRQASDQRTRRPEAEALLGRVRAVIFIATPHKGSAQATWMDWLRLVVWPAMTTRALARNDPQLRELNTWYRNWSDGVVPPLKHQIFYESRPSAAGLIVDEDSADPGFAEAVAVPIDANHTEICKPLNRDSLVYASVRSFTAKLVDSEAVSDEAARVFERVAIADGRPRLQVAHALRLALVLLVLLVGGKGVHAMFVSTSTFSNMTAEQLEQELPKIIEIAREKQPKLTDEQIESIRQALRSARGAASFARAVAEAKTGNMEVVEGLLKQIYEDRKLERVRVERDMAKAQRERGAVAVLRNARDALELYREATVLDPGNLDGWVGFGDAALLAGTLREASRAFQTLAPLAKATGLAWEGFSYDRLGDVLVAEGKLAEARKHYEDSVSIREGLAAADPTSAAEQRHLSVSYEKLGDASVAEGKLAEAHKHYEDSLAIRKGLAAADPKSAVKQRDLSVSYSKLGDVSVAEGKLAEARKQYEDSLVSFKGLAAAGPTRADKQRDLSVSYDRLGDVLVAEGKLAEARKQCEDSLAIRKGLAAADPTSADAQRALSVSYERLGNVLVAEGKLAEARKLYEDSLAIAKRLAEADPISADKQRDLSVSYHRLGDVLLAEGKLAEARKQCEDALAITKPVAEADPTNAEKQGDLSVSYNKLGDVLVAEGKLAEARKLYEDSLAIRERQAGADSTNAKKKRDLSASYNKLGDVFKAEGKLAEARKLYEHALAIAKHLADADPTNAANQLDLSLSYGKVGDVFKAEGKLAEAHKQYEDALAIAKHLAYTDSTSAAKQRHLSACYGKVGDVLKAEGKLEGARERYGDALTILLNLESPAVPLLPKVDFTVDGLNAAPNYVMFVYPVGGSFFDDTPSSALTVISEGERNVLGRPRRTPALYLMKAAAFRSWRAAHPVVHELDDNAAAEKLIHGKQVVQCDALLAPMFNTSRFKLLKGNAARCRMCIRAAPSHCLRRSDSGYEMYASGDLKAIASKAE